VKLGPLHHVAIAVPSVSESVPFYRDVLGLRAGPVRDVPDQRVRVAFLGDDRQLLELVEPLDPDSGRRCITSVMSWTISRARSQGSRTRGSSSSTARHAGVPRVTWPSSTRVRQAASSSS